MPGEYFEARERALLGTRYDVLYAAPCAVRRGVTVNGLRCAPQEFAAAVDFGLEPSPFCDAAFLLTDPQLRPGRHAYHHAGVFYVQEPSASVPAGLVFSKLCPQYGHAGRPESALDRQLLQTICSPTAYIPFLFRLMLRAISGQGPLRFRGYATRSARRRHPQDGPEGCPFFSGHPGRTGRCRWRAPWPRPPK